nr:hypothetical protein [Tanacetum cinerariifolium]
TKLSDRVLNLETTKTAKAKEIANLKKIVKRLERKRKSRSHGLKRLYKVRLSARVESSADEESLARKLQEEIYEQEILIEKRARQEEEANSALIETWEDIQAKVEADYEMAERLHAEEQEQFTDAEKAKLFMKFIERRRKFFAAKRDEEKRKKPPTNAQQRSIMTTYLKNMDGWKPKALKNKSIADIKELFDKAMERINSFVDFKTELVEESTKKYKAVTVQESSSKRA